MTVIIAALLLAASTSASVVTLPEEPKPQTFLHNHVNQALVATEFSARLLDAISTRQVLDNPCDCYEERGNYGMKSLTASGTGQLSYSLAMAAGQTEVASLLWRRGARSTHRRLYHLASRALLLTDIVYDSVDGSLGNWTKPSSKPGMIRFGK